MDNRYLRDRARRARRDRRRGRRRDRSYNNDYRNDYRMDHMDEVPYMPNYNVGHYLYDGSGDDYEKDLEEWIHDLKKHDRFGLSKEEVIKKAKDMGVRFHDYDETEFYVTYLMMISDFKHVPNDPHQYLVMAKEWLEDEDAMRRGSEKLCAHYYAIVLGED